MKKSAILFLIPICNSVYAQIPPQEKNEVRMEGYNTEYKEYSTSSEEVIQNLDIVKGIFYESDGRKTFVIKNDTKKGTYDNITTSSYGNNYIVTNKKLYGLANNKGELVSKIKYDSLGSSHLFNGSYIVKENGKYGLISSKGEEVIPTKYNKIYSRNENITLLKNNKNQIDIIFNKSKKGLNKKIDQVQLYRNLAIVKVNGKYGLINNDVNLPFEYDSIYNPSKEPDGYNLFSSNNNSVKSTSSVQISNEDIPYLAIKKGSKVGLASKDGMIIYPVEYDDVFNYHYHGYYTVKKDNKYGIFFSKSKSKAKTEVEFEQITSQGYGPLYVSKNKKAGIFNLEGIQVIPFEYDVDSFYNYDNAGYRVSKNNKQGIIDKTGKVIIEPVYDKIQPLPYGSSDFFSVKNGDKYGIVNKENKIIVPIDYEHLIDFNEYFLVNKYNLRFGLYDKTGKLIAENKYETIYNTATPDSKIIFLKEFDESINLLNSKKELVFQENIVDYGYLLNEEKLYSPEGRNGIIFVKNKKGKYALFNEISEELKSPFDYDEIIQCTNTGERIIYYSVRKGNKYGLINSDNQIILPIEYDAIDLDLAKSTLYFDTNKQTSNHSNHFQIVVAKGKKYGTVNLKNEVVIPFKHSYLKRLSYNGFFKTKVGNKFQIIDREGKLVTQELFDEVANFERIHSEYSDDYVFQGLTFKDGKMRVLDNNGNFVTNEVLMSKHKGFETFDELKWAFIEALDSKDNVLLKEFADKISPSEHLLHYLKVNVFSNTPLDVNVSFVKEKYYEHLLKFKYNEWNSGYRRISLYIDDYSSYSSRTGLVTNSRTEDHGYGNSNFTERLLRSSVKVNGYWISTFFMDRRF